MDESATEFQIVLIEHPVSVGALAEMAEHGFGDMVKVVVDVEQRVMAIGAELHSDEEAFLLNSGSMQANLWGINLYPEAFGTPDFVEFDSMINLRPGQNNRSRSVEDPTTQRTILTLVEQLVSAGPADG